MPDVFDTVATVDAKPGLFDQVSGGFDTQLSGNEESRFQQWKSQVAPNDSGQDYDFRGAYKAGVAPDASGHWPDTFKKPNHPTFSDQSIYAKDAPNKAGKWKGDVFIPPSSSKPDLFDQVAADYQAPADSKPLFDDSLQPTNVDRAVGGYVSSALKIPGKLGLMAGNIMAGGPQMAPHWPTDQEVQAPVVSPELARAMITAPFGPGVSSDKFAKTGVQGAVRGAVEGAGDALSSFTTPESVGLLGIAPEGKLAQRAIAGVFLGQAIQGTPEQWKAFNEAQNLADKIRIATSMGLGYALPAAGLLHARAGEVQKVGTAPGGDTAVSPQRAPETAPVDPAAAQGIPSETAIARDVPPIPQPDITKGGTEVNALADVSAAPNPEPSTVRLYHGASKGIGQAGRDFTTSLQYAQGYADKANGGGQVWYVDVPQGLLKTHDEYGQPMSRVVVPDEIANQAKPLEAPSVQEAPLAHQQEVFPPKANPEPPSVSDTTGQMESTPTSTDRVSEDPFVSRIANRFSQERATQGEIGEIAPGQGYATSDLVNRGLRMAPEEIAQHVSDVMQEHGNDPVAQAAAIRAEEARLSDRSTELSRVAESQPTNLVARQAANSAFQDLTDFHNGPVAKLKQRFHATGMALQGEIPVDLSTFNGLREAWLKENGTAPPTKMEPMFRRTAENVRRITGEERAAANRLGLEIEKATKGRKLPTADEVRNNIRERMGLGPCRV